MKESRVNPAQYIVLQGWMISELKLKGNELIIYACIYGFSQAENQIFNGSLQYLADWTNSTKQGVMRCLKSLVEKGLIEKTEKLLNGVKFCEYQVTKLNGVCNKVEHPMQQSLPPRMQQSLPNNIPKDKLPNNIDKIIEYLNEKTGQNFRSSTKATRQHINARLAEGFTLDDFKRVVDNMWTEWHGTEWEQYLRPSTLFGSKFENYLNRKPQGRRTEKKPNWMQPSMKLGSAELEAIQKVLKEDEEQKDFSTEAEAFQKRLQEVRGMDCKQNQ